MTLDELIHKYPKIFDKSTYTIGWWAPLSWIPMIDEMCQKIQDWCDTQPPESQVICHQMKEKFGGLRFYVNFATDDIYKLINIYEKQSYKMCQECGCTDCQLFKTKGWISFICQECAIKLNKQIHEDQLHTDTDG